jgi:methionyl aminopeptidase
VKILNDAQINNMRYAGGVLSGALNAVRLGLRAGMTTAEVDRIAEEYIVEHDCTPCFKGVYGYKFACNTSVNDEIIHGMPSKNKVLGSGDIITVDCGAGFNGICTDACRTFAVGEISAEAEELIAVTKECFERAFRAVHAGAEVAVVCKTITKYLDSIGGYSILEDFFGHGIGKNLHEDPLIPNYVPRHPRLRAEIRKKFLPNTAICIEPMIFHGGNRTKIARDGWTVISVDGCLSAHYENTILITKNGTEILTDKYC